MAWLPNRHGEMNHPARTAAGLSPRRVAEQCRARESAPRPRCHRPPNRHSSEKLQPCSRPTGSRLIPQYLYRVRRIRLLATVEPLKGLGLHRQVCGRQDKTSSDASGPSLWWPSLNRLVLRPSPPQIRGIRRRGSDTYTVLPLGLFPGEPYAKAASQVEKRCP